MASLRPTDAAIFCRENDSAEAQSIGDQASYRELVGLGPLRWCREPALDWYPRPIDVVLRYEPTQTLVQPFNAGPLIVRNELFRAIKPYLTTQIVGKVFIKDGSEKRESYECVSLYDTTPHEVRVLGNEKNTYLYCDKCGRTAGGIEYGGMWITKKQREGWNVAFWGMSLLITPRVAENIRWQDFPTLRPVPIHFRD